jgi:hypothetical protein
MAGEIHHRHVGARDAVCKLADDPPKPLLIEVLAVDDVEAERLSASRIPCASLTGLASLSACRYAALPTTRATRLSAWAGARAHASVSHMMALI